MLRDTTPEMQVGQRERGRAGGGRCMKAQWRVVSAVVCVLGSDRLPGR